MSRAGRATACSAGSTSRCPWASCTRSSCAQRCCCAGALSGTALLEQCWFLCLHSGAEAQLLSQLRALATPTQLCQQVVPGPAHVQLEA